MSVIKHKCVKLGKKRPMSYYDSTLHTPKFTKLGGSLTTIAVTRHSRVVVTPQSLSSSHN